jgi:sucrose phosphorylase
MVSLITYADRLAGDLKGLHTLLEGDLEGLFSGVHILPFYTPIDGADAGFDPIDHLAVDSRVGTWDDITRLASGYSVMTDMIVNHVSAESPQFTDVVRHGEESRFWDLFLRPSDVFHEDDTGVDEAVRKIYRPRPGAPFTTRTLDTGESYEFWTTLSANQLDINVEAPEGQRYLTSILERFAEAGVREVRLDAAGYVIKRAGTSCFMLPETFDFIGALSAAARALGIETLVEIHSHYQIQCEIAERVGRVYDFALPPLVLHTLYTDDASALKHWLGIAPRNCITVLDTHDGIGIVDVGRDGERPGLLADEQIDALVKSIHDKTGGKSRQASGHAASNLDIYQVNSTYYDALGGSDIDYLIARAIQFFVPGTPQVYYVGLLAGENDLDLVGCSGVGRDINRHYYTDDELKDALRRPVVKELMSLIRLRNSLSVFDGAFSIEETPANELTLRWCSGDDYSQLRVRLKERVATISGKQDGRAYHYQVGDLSQNLMVAM